MPKAAIFDMDGTLVDSVDLHAAAWQEAFERFGHAVSFEDCRSQIGKGGDQFLPVFLSEAAVQIEVPAAGAAVFGGAAVAAARARRWLEGCGCNVREGQRT